eukprot:907526-Amorphochlora_amoeboformis.AAC.1
MTYALAGNSSRYDFLYLAGLLLLLKAVINPLLFGFLLLPRLYAARTPGVKLKVAPVYLTNF